MAIIVDSLTIDKVVNSFSCGNLSSSLTIKLLKQEPNFFYCRRSYKAKCFLFVITKRCSLSNLASMISPLLFSIIKLVIWVPWESRRRISVSPTAQRLLDKYSSLIILVELRLSSYIFYF